MKRYVLVEIETDSEQIKDEVDEALAYGPPRLHAPFRTADVTEHLEVDPQSGRAWLAPYHSDDGSWVELS